MELRLFQKVARDGDVDAEKRGKEWGAEKDEARGEKLSGAEKDEARGKDGVVGPTPGTVPNWPAAGVAASSPQEITVSTPAGRLRRESGSDRIGRLLLRGKWNRLTCRQTTASRKRAARARHCP